MALLRKLFWLALYAVATLSFVVLFEHGVDNFGENFKKQVNTVHAYIDKQIKGGESKKSS